MRNRVHVYRKYPDEQEKDVSKNQKERRKEEKTEKKKKLSLSSSSNETNRDFKEEMNERMNECNVCPREERSGIAIGVEQCEEIYERQCS